MIRVSMLAVTALWCGATHLAAHGVVVPRESRPRAYERYVLRVPNERTSSTVRVELAFPPEVRVVSFGDVPGWVLQVVRDSAGRATGAVWTGTLGVERFVEFPFVAVNPAEPTRLVWRSEQLYANGERVSWSGPEGSETPASVTHVRGAGPSAGVALVLAGAAVLLGLTSLGLVLRRPA